MLFNWMRCAIQGHHFKNGVCGRCGNGMVEIIRHRLAHGKYIVEPQHATSVTADDSSDEVTSEFTRDITSRHGA